MSRRKNKTEYMDRSERARITSLENKEEIVAFLRARASSNIQGICPKAIYSRRDCPTISGRGLTVNEAQILTFLSRIVYWWHGERHCKKCRKQRLINFKKQNPTYFKKWRKNK